MRHRHPVVSVVSAGLIYGLLACDNAHQWGTIEGSVVDKAGEPVAFAVISIKGMTRRTGTDGAGRFVIDRLPPGTYTVYVTGVGFHRSAREVHLDDESVDVAVGLSEMEQPPPGVPYPSPTGTALRHARFLLSHVVQDSRFIAAVDSAVASDSAVVAWAPWADQLDSTFVVHGRRVELTSDCSECVERIRMMIEGGSGYDAGINHVRVGATALGPDRRILIFCIRPMRPGDDGLEECTHIHSSDVLSYERQRSRFRRDRLWIQTQ